MAIYSLLLHTIDKGKKCVIRKPCEKKAKLVSNYTIYV